MGRTSAQIRDRPIFSRPAALGLLIGALAFVAALTPSMIPRNELLQGVLAGLSFALGYGVGALIVSTGRFLGFVSQQPGDRPMVLWMGVIAAVVIVIVGLAHVQDWQDGVRRAMRQPPVEDFQVILVALVSFGVAALLLLLGRIFRRAWLVMSKLLFVLMPERAAILAGFVLALILFWSLGSGVLTRGVVDMMDAGYAKVDALIPPDVQPPASALRSGSAQSLVPWKSLGAQGRSHMLAAPTQAEISQLTGRPAMEPIRVYVGVNSAKSPEARAALALAEMKRAGAFDRGTVVIATPTGTGWVDPAGTAPMEYLLQGDVATVSVQYSYLPSWLSLMVEPERGAETAKAVFRTIYGYWSSLPQDKRPKLYLFGLSLGALNSDLSVDVYDIFGAPFDGALWAGPPFASRTWNTIIGARNNGTPVWHPRYSDGRMFRFETQGESLSNGYAKWGPIRIIYLQYPSDPIVFFEPNRVLRAPAIFDSPRASDLSSDLMWVPGVSFLQLVVDMVTAAGAPVGYGHVYAASDYLDCWIALLEPVGWTPGNTARLREKLGSMGL